MDSDNLLAIEQKLMSTLKEYREILKVSEAKIAELQQKQKLLEDEQTKLKKESMIV